MGWGVGAERKGAGVAVRGWPELATSWTTWGAGWLVGWTTTRLGWAGLVVVTRLFVDTITGLT